MAHPPRLHEATSIFSLNPTVIHSDDQTKLIGLPPDERPPPELRTSAGRRRAFPPTCSSQASHRLQILALVGAGSWILGPALGHLALALTDPARIPVWARLNITD